MMGVIPLANSDSSCERVLCTVVPSWCCFGRSKETSMEHYEALNALQLTVPTVGEA